MPIYTLAREQKVPLSLERCWDFFSNPGNLAKITPPTLGFCVKSEVPPEIYPGLMIRYTVSPLFGIPMTWLTEITHVARPHHFVDEQRVGPYRALASRAFLRARWATSETLVRDLVHYVPPLGPLGALLHPLLVRPQLERIFDFRTAQLEKLARGSFA